jgi:hypothetical protein
MALDLRKVPIGSWSEYSYSMKPANSTAMKITTRWSLVARDVGTNTMEMKTSGGPTAAVGGVFVVVMIMTADPTASPAPIKRVILQVGKTDPMELPLDPPILPILQTKFEKPDAKDLVGEGLVTVPAGTFKGIHYHRENEKEIVDMWISDGAPPLGILRSTVRPIPGILAENGQPPAVFTMELSASGHSTKPTVTGPVKPFDPSMFGGVRKPSDQRSNGATK